MLNKLVIALISPLGTSLILGVLALLILSLAQRKSLRCMGVIAGAMAVAWLWLWSTPLASEALRGWIENQDGPRLLSEVPEAPVIVVLGGGMNGPRPPARPDPDLGSAADRVWHAARLYKAGKAKRLLLSGGVVRTGDGSEAGAMRSLLIDLGVPANAMIIEPGSSNTIDNSRKAAVLLAKEGIDEVLLVTSALHMPRARRIFENTGIKVLPAPTDFEVIPMPFDLLRVIPNAGALNGSARAMKELVGWMVLNW